MKEIYQTIPTIKKKIKQIYYKKEKKKVQNSKNQTKFSFKLYSYYIIF